MKDKKKLSDMITRPRNAFLVAVCVLTAVFVALRACVGFAACAVTIIIAVIMIVKGSRKGA